MTMRRLRVVLVGAALVAGLALAAGLLAAGQPPVAALTALAGPAWLVFWRRGIGTALDAGLAVLILGAGIALSMGAPAAIMLVGTVAALIAWDLMHLDLRLRAFRRVDHEAEIVRRHVQWLLIATGAGLGVAGLALAVRAQISFTAMFILGVLAAAALGRAIRLLRQ
jgi:hypothetical protein